MERLKISIARYLHEHGTQKATELARALGVSEARISAACEEMDNITIHGGYISLAS